MARKDIDAFWERKTRNDINDNFKELYEAPEKIEGLADEAVNRSNTAMFKADEAKQQSERTEKELSQAILKGDSSPLAGQLSVGSDGKVYDSAQERLIKENETITSQLADTVFQNKITSGSVRYGLLNLPSDFSKTLSFQLYRDNLGNIKHTFDFEKLIPSASVYLSRSGSEDNSGLDKNNPVYTLTKALSIADGLSGSTINIIFLDKFISMYLVNPFEPIKLNKNINLISELDGGSYIISGYDPHTFNWTRDGNAYKTTRSAVKYVVDYADKDFLSKPSELKKVSSLNLCKSTRGTWYTDGTSVWVNRLSGGEPDGNVALILTLSNQFKFELGSNTLFVDGINFWNHYTGSLTQHALIASGLIGGRYIARDTSYRYAKNNGLNHENVGEIYHFNSSAEQNGYDGFNYHGSGDEFVFEYYCESFGNGEFAGGTGNATTAHDGMTTLRVSPIGRDCRGPLLADVNGCKSMVIDGKMSDSTLNDLNRRQSAAYYFDDSLAEAPGKAWLLNCEGGGKNTYSLSSDGEIEIELIERFVGNRIHVNAMSKLTYRE